MDSHRCHGFVGEKGRITRFECHSEKRKFSILSTETTYFKKEVNTPKTQKRVFSFSFGF